MNKFKCLTVTAIIMDEDMYGTLNRKELNDCISLGKYVSLAKIYVRNGESRIDWKP